MGYTSTSRVVKGTAALWGVIAVVCFAADHPAVGVASVAIAGVLAGVARWRSSDVSRLG